MSRVVCEGAVEVRIRRKPADRYVRRITRLLAESGADRVVVKARGRGINRAVDIVEAVRRHLEAKVQVEDLAINIVKTHDANRRPAEIAICLKRVQ